MNIKKLLMCALSLPKSICFCLHYLPLKQAVRIPIFVSYDTHITQMRGKVLLKSEKIMPGMVHIGLNKGSFDCGKNQRTTLQFQNGSKLIFHGKAAIASGAVINNGGTIEFGDCFSSNFGLFITCSENVSFGDNCLLGWNNHFLDNNGHKIFDESGVETSSPKKIVVGNNVWITSETHFLSGASVGDGCVVGYQAFVLKDFLQEKNSLIAGNPAKVLRKNIVWSK